MDNITHRRHIRRGSPGRGLVPIICLVFVSVAFCALPGCSPRIIENTKTEYVYRDRVQVDTTWLKDSIWIKEWVKGDTVRIIEHRDHLVYQYKYLRDTVAVVDSVAVERVKEVPIEKPLSAGQKFKIGAFWWLLAVALGLAGWTFRKPLLSLVKRFL